MARTEKMFAKKSLPAVGSQFDRANLQLEPHKTNGPATLAVFLQWGLTPE
jgi:hypothetical protein